MEELIKYAGVFALFANLLVYPALNYFVDKRFDAKIEPMEARFMKAIAEQKVQIDKEYLDIRDKIDRKADKHDIAFQDLNRNLNAVVQSFNDRMIKNEIDTKGLIVNMENGSKHYEAFQKTANDNFNRLHERLDLIYKELNKS
jgi:hypothetical protein